MRIVASLTPSIFVAAEAAEYLSDHLRWQGRTDTGSATHTLDDEPQHEGVHIFEEWFKDGFGGGHAYSVSQQRNATARREAALGSIGFIVMSYLLTSMARRF